MSTDNRHSVTISADTRIHDLLQTYPWLADRLIELSSNFKPLKNPVMRNTIGRVATLRRAAAMGSLKLEDLLNAVADAIREQEQIEVNVESSKPVAEDQQQLDDLKALILSLHAGNETMESAKEKFQHQFGSVPAKDIAMMEQQLISEGLPVEMIQELCDVHVGIMGEGAAGTRVAEQTPGHPVYTFVAENLALKQITHAIRQLIDSHTGNPGKLFAGLNDQLSLLKQVERHYLRKENLLFPKLEREGFEGPSKVMWAIHDEIRAELKAVNKALENEDAAAVLKQLPPLLTKIDDMVTKEETILLPTSIEMLQHEDWADIHKQEEELGFALVERGGEWSPRIKMPAPGQPSASDHFKQHHPLFAEEADDANEPAYRKNATTSADSVVITHGHLTQKQLDRILLALPVELSFVDENDEVCYFTGVADKIFPRTPAVIGRKVQNCHPPKSLNMVNRILSEMKAGTRDTAQFWMDDFAGKFVFIRYDAVRDEDGTYLGCLESVQDVSQIRKLTGSKRLMDEN
ncbi:DUF438 domain-containing protein [bacterium]|nr:DUF438 domain-containing protein [bacterium]